MYCFVLCCSFCDILYYFFKASVFVLAASVNKYQLGWTGVEHRCHRTVKKRKFHCPGARRRRKKDDLITFQPTRCLSCVRGATNPVSRNRKSKSIILPISDPPLSSRQHAGGPSDVPCRMIALNATSAAEYFINFRPPVYSRTYR